MSKTIDLTVPDIGGFNDVPVVEVLVSAGQTVAKDAALVTLESDKATMEVPAEAAGTIADVKVKVGDKVSQGSILATLTVEDGAPTPAPQPTAPLAAAAGAPAAPSPERSTESAEHAEPDANEPRAETARAETARPSTSSNGTSNAPSAAAQPPVPVNQNGGSSVHASPGTRRFARELGVDLAHVGGTGPNGRIVREDVQGFVKHALADGAGAKSSIGLGLPPWPQIDFAKFGPIERVPLSRIKRLSGPNLARNWVMIPHVTQNDEADVTDLETFRKELNSEQSDVKVTMLAFLIKAVVATLRRYPEFNSSLADGEMVLKRYYNIGFAADTPEGLVVPVLRGADQKGIFEIARETSDLARKARDGKLGLSEMQGGTFTISSLGGIGGTSFTPIINAPEVAILGAVRVAVRPLWNGKEFEPRSILPLSLSYDHRAVDGAAAARFCAYLAKTLGDLRRTML